MLHAIDRVYLADFGYRGQGELDHIGTGLGVERSEKPVTRGFSVTATQRGELVDIEVEPFAARQGQTGPANRQVQNIQTRLRVEPGKWVTVGGGSALENRAKTYGTSTKLDESMVLIKVDPVVP